MPFKLDINITRARAGRSLPVPCPLCGNQAETGKLSGQGGNLFWVSCEPACGFFELTRAALSELSKLSAAQRLKLSNLASSPPFGMVMQIRNPSFLPNGELISVYREAEA